MVYGYVSNKASAYVYFIRNSLGHIKIGITDNIRKRMESLQTANSMPLEFLCQLKVKDMEEARLVETELHEKFMAFNTHGEWFAGKPIIEWLTKEKLETKYYTFNGFEKDLFEKGLISKEMKE